MVERYSLGVDWNSAGRPEPCAKTMDSGRFMLYEDHAALLRAVAEEVKKVKCEQSAFLPNRPDCRLCDSCMAKYRALALLEVKP